MYLAGAQRLIEIVNVTVSVVRQGVVAHIHLVDAPFQRRRGFLCRGNNGRDQVGNPRVGGKFHSFRVDQNEPDLFRGGPHHDGGNHRVDERRFTRPGRAGDQQVRGLGDVSQDVISLHVLADPGDQRVGKARGRFGTQHVAEVNVFAVRIGDFNPDSGFPWNGRQNPHFRGRHGVSNILGQPLYLRDFFSRTECDFVLGHRRPARKAGDLGCDPELLKHIGQGLDDAVVRRGTFHVFRPDFQQVERGQVVVDVVSQAGVDAFGQDVLGFGGRFRRGRRLGRLTLGLMPPGLFPSRHKFGGSGRGLWLGLSRTGVCGLHGRGRVRLHNLGFLRV